MYVYLAALAVSVIIYIAILLSLDPHASCRPCLMAPVLWTYIVYSSSLNVENM